MAGEPRREVGGPGAVGRMRAHMKVRILALSVVLLASPGEIATAGSAPEGAICIDVGRQLFVDDYLIADSKLGRSFHRARLHPASPVLRPETAVERDEAHGFRLP